MAPTLFESEASHPVADRLRPRRLEDVVGQDHLLTPEAPIGRAAASLSSAVSSARMFARSIGSQGCKRGRRRDRSPRIKRRRVVVRSIVALEPDRH